MTSFDETLKRMKDLYTYGKELDESNTKISTHTLEHHAIAADGNAYGIVKECSKYYIKSAPQSKEMVAEAYDYLGGICNKKRYEYDSYNNALKNFDLKMSSIKEACEGNVSNAEGLDNFKSTVFMTEGTEAMRDEIARQRQIMYNAAMLMNESTEIGATRKDDVVKFNGENPEAEHGKKGDENYDKTNAQPEFKGTDTKGVDKSVTPFDEKAPKVNEACDAAGCDSEKEDWGSVGLNKGEDPKKVGWDIEGQTTVNEENDWASEGLPATPGVGEADTKDNNQPFVNTVNEEEEPETDDLDAALDAKPEEGEFDGTDDFEITDDEEDFSLGTDDEPAVEDVPVEDEPATEDEPAAEEDLKAQIEALQSQIDELKAKLDGEAATEDEPAVEDVPVEDEPATEDEPAVEDVPVEDEPATEDEPIDDPEDEDTFDDEEEIELNEAQKAALDRIVESVVREVVKEEELHVFGKHPGYQKKPMELPTTGEDSTEHGEDWNDESVHNEQPFGEKIGDGKPFDQAVNSVTKNVIEKLMEMQNKKKVK